MKKYSKEYLIEKLKELSIKLGKTPTIKDLRKEKNIPSYIAFYTNFRSWNNALKSAGLNLNYEYKFYSEKELLDLLIKFKKNKGRSPKIEDFQKDTNLPAPNTYFDRFGSWNNALKLANLEINERKDYRNDELINILKKLSKELGRTPMMRDLESKKDLPCAEVFKIHFSSWNNALKYAGLEIKYHYRKWTKQEIINWLRYKYDELGKTPGIRDFDKDPKAPGKNTARKLFGNWTNALRQARIPVKRFNSKEELIEAMKKLAKKLNKTPTRTDMNNAKGFPSYTPFVKKFGSYTAACLRAGLSQNDGRNNNIWKAWQKHCEQMAKFIYENIEIQKNGIVEGTPDIYIPNENLLIDAKTCGYKDFKDQIKKYGKKHKLEFWLIFKGIETKRKNVKYIYAEELANRMNRLGRKDLAAKCYQFVKNVYSDGQKTLE